MLEEYLVLVDENDKQTGTAEKMDAHRRGVLHRAFSIFIFNRKGEMLLQKRAHAKYHSGGLWTNSCCGHPRPDESTLSAAHRRLAEEMGFGCDLREIFSFMYNAKLEHGLIENEYDHVLFGDYDGVVKINREEAEDYRWISMDDLKKEIAEQSEKYTVWFKICFDEVIKNLK